jgi:glycosyltransferase involved in cell wall biosynthesis
VRALFLTHYFPPEPGAPQARLAALTRALAERGHEVTVHTGFPHYPDGRILPPYRNRPLQRERREGGVRVLRTAVAARPNRGTAARLLDQGSFCASALAAAPLAGRQDVVVAESPPLPLAGAAVGYARMARAALVVNVADLWPATAVELGALRPGRALRAAEALEAFAYRHADAITTPTEGLVAALEGHPAAAGRVHHMPPLLDLARVPRSPVPEGDGPLRVLYAGNVGLAQGVGTLVEAGRLLGGEVDVTIAGSGAEASEVRAAAAGAPVRLLGAVAPAEVRSLLEATHVVVVLLRARPLFDAALPTKMVEAMAAGRPLVLAARGEAAGHAAAAGQTVVAPEDPRALAGALRGLASRRAELPALGEAARRYALERFDPAAVVDRWGALLERVAQPR